MAGAVRQRRYARDAASLDGPRHDDFYAGASNISPGLGDNIDNEHVFALDGDCADWTGAASIRKVRRLLLPFAHVFERRRVEREYLRFRSAYGRTEAALFMIVGGVGGAGAGIPILREKLTAFGMGALGLGFAVLAVCGLIDAVLCVCLASEGIRAQHNRAWRHRTLQNVGWAASTALTGTALLLLADGHVCGPATDPRFSTDDYMCLRALAMPLAGSAFFAAAMLRDPPIAVAVALTQCCIMIASGFVVSDGTDSHYVFRTVWYAVYLFFATGVTIARDRADRAAFVSVVQLHKSRSEIAEQRDTFRVVVRSALPSRLVHRLVQLRQAADGTVPLDKLSDHSENGIAIATSAVGFGALATAKLLRQTIQGLHTLCTFFDAALRAFNLDHGGFHGDTYVATSGLGRPPCAVSALSFAWWQVNARLPVDLPLHAAVVSGDLAGAVAGSSELRYVVGGAAVRTAMNRLPAVPTGRVWADSRFVARYGAVSAGGGGPSGGSGPSLLHSAFRFQLVNCSSGSPNGTPPNPTALAGSRGRAKLRSAASSTHTHSDASSVAEEVGDRSLLWVDVAGPPAPTDEECMHSFDDIHNGGGSNPVSPAGFQRQYHQRDRRDSESSGASSESFTRGEHPAHRAPSPRQQGAGGRPAAAVEFVVPPPAMPTPDDTSGELDFAADAAENPTLREATPMMDLAHTPCNERPSESDNTRTGTDFNFGHADAQYNPVTTIAALLTPLAFAEAVESPPLATLDTSAASQALHRQLRADGAGSDDMRSADDVARSKHAYVAGCGGSFAAPEDEERFQRYHASRMSHAGPLAFVPAALLWLVVTIITAAERAATPDDSYTESTASDAVGFVFLALATLGAVLVPAEQGYRRYIQSRLDHARLGGSGPAFEGGSMMSGRTDTHGAAAKASRVIKRTMSVAARGVTARYGSRFWGGAHVHSRPRKRKNQEAGGGGTGAFDVVSARDTSGAAASAAATESPEKRHAARVRYLRRLQICWVLICAGSLVPLYLLQRTMVTNRAAAMFLLLVPGSAFMFSDLRWLPCFGALLVHAGAIYGAGFYHTSTIDVGMFIVCVGAALLSSRSACLHERQSCAAGLALVSQRGVIAANARALADVVDRVVPIHAVSPALAALRAAEGERVAAGWANATAEERFRHLLSGGPLRVKLAEGFPDFACMEVRLRVHTLPDDGRGGATSRNQVAHLWATIEQAVDSQAGTHRCVSLLSTLGDSFQLGGPFSRDENALRQAAEASIRVLASLAATLQMAEFTAVGVIEEAVGALLGEARLRYRVFGVAPLQCSTLADEAGAMQRAAPTMSRVPVRVAFLTRRFANAAGALVDSMSRPQQVTGVNADGSLAYFSVPPSLAPLRPQRWRVQATGVTVVYPLTFATPMLVAAPMHPPAGPQMSASHQFASSQLSEML